MKAILMDMDGVLVDFIAGLHARLELPYDRNDFKYPLGNYDCFDAMLNCHKEQLKTIGKIYRASDGSEFWRDLDWEVYGRSCMDVARKSGARIYICTKPMMRAETWAGKVEWIQKNIPGGVLAGAIITSGPKHMLAKPDHMLIDDKDANVDEFRAAGGYAYLVPQPWNSRHDEASVDYSAELAVEINKFLGK